MKFSEAMEKLQSGSKVTRKTWENNIYFIMNGLTINFRRQRITNFTYNEDIMISNGWMVEGKEDEFKFYDIIEHLLNGLKVKFKEWKEEYIVLDKNSHDIIFHEMETYTFIPTLKDFVAEDWMEVL